MSTRETTPSLKKTHLAIAIAIVMAAIIPGGLPSAAAPISINPSATKGPFQFEPLLTSAPCTPGGNALPFALPDGYAQHYCSQTSSQMCPTDTVNENGRQAGRFIYRTHELEVSRFCYGLWTGETQFRATPGRN